jgi:putative membrane protein
MKTKNRIVSQFCILALTVGALSLVGAARGADTTPTGSGSSLSEKDKTFMKKAAKGGTMEVTMGKVAEQNAQSDDGNSFGKRMLTDHGKANDELKSIASKKGFELPNKEHAGKSNSDKAYMDMMVKDHEKVVAEF